MSARHRANARDDIHGLLLVDKPAGCTSHDVVDSVRRRFNLRKVGHGGTLDPMATGLLVLLLGRGTKLSQQVMASDKTYEGVMCLGVSTSTQDVEGEILQTCEHLEVSWNQLLAEMERWRGDVWQTPPMTSAIKRNGVPLYKLARKGKEVVREPRLLHIYDFSLLNFEPPRADFRLRATKGAYVRTLCADVGDGLGCGAHLESLRRTASGPLSLDDALPADAILDMEVHTLSECVISPARFMAREA